jgi:superfamily II DNA or RNA helicase
MTREEVQASFTSSIIQNKYSGIFVCSPRVGKTRSLLAALTPIQHLKILVVVPFNTIKQSWEKEIIKWNYKGNLDIVLRTSLKTVDLTSYNLIVKDECHLISESEITLYKEAKKPICAITGTLGKYASDKWKYRLGVIEKFRYDVIDAVEDSIISDYSVTVHYCKLDNKDQYIEVNGKLLTEQQAYARFTSSMEYHGNKGNTHLKLFFAGRRARLIYSSKEKIEKAKSLIKSKRRVLVFTALTEVANKLCKQTVHSKSLDKQVLSKFQSGKINKVSAIGMIDMGVTLKNLKYCLAHQLNSKEERAIQRILRVMNIEGDKKAEIDVLCVKGTVDETWVTSSLSFVPETKIKYLNYET